MTLPSLPPLRGFLPVNVYGWINPDGVLTAASCWDISICRPVPVSFLLNSAVMMAIAPFLADVSSICCRVVPIGGLSADPVTA